MSADNDPEGSNRELSRTPTTVSSGLVLPPPREQKQQLKTVLGDMPAMTLRSPPLPPMLQQMAYDEQRQFRLSRPRTQVEPVELPSIRQAVPEIQTRGNRETHYRTDSPRQRSPFSSRFPEPLKRRRITPDDGDESDPRDPMFQRRSRSPTRPGHMTYRSTASPSSSARRGSVQSTSDSRNGSTRPSPHSQTRTLPPIRSPSMESVGLPSRQEWRPMLPSLPPMTFDQRGPVPLIRRDSNLGEYAYDSLRSGSQVYSQQQNSYEPPPHVSSGYANNFHARGPSYHGSSERTPFSNHHQYSNSSNFPYGTEVQDSGAEGKQRKRRGNLPKETTDKLRAWFVGHVQHPYPTEDEKQDLMRQTGLLMNQISNWFINARRRQLPAMMNNARAEIDARSARGPETSNSNGADFGSQQRSSGTSPESEDVGSGYDEEYLDRPREMRGF